MSAEQRCPCITCCCCRLIFWLDSHIDVSRCLGFQFHNFILHRKHHTQPIITGRIARRTNWRYFVFSEIVLFLFRLAGADVLHRCIQFSRICILGFFPDLKKLTFCVFIGIGQTIIFSSCGFFFMAALCNRAGHYIFAMWFLSSSFFFLSSFFAKSQRPQIRCLPYFGTWCGLSANTGNTGRKNRHFGTMAQRYRVISS